MSQETPQLHAERFGTCGQPILLLVHGVARNGHDWDDLISSLKMDWDVIAIDQRGHGQAGRTGSYYVIDFARDLVEFIRESIGQSLTILGHSLGAMTALYAATQCSERIERAILEDPPFHTMGKRIEATPYHAQFLGMQQVARRGGSVEAMCQGLGEIIIPTASRPMRLADLRDLSSLRFSAECLQSVDPEVFTPLVAGKWLENFDHAELWRQTKCPVVLLQGDPGSGGACSDEDVERAIDDCPSLTVKRFPGVNHQIHRTVPQAIIELLRQGRPALH